MIDKKTEKKPYVFGGGIMPIVIYATSPEEAQKVLQDRLKGKSHDNHS